MKIHWGRIVAAAFLLEIALIVVFIPVSLWTGMEPLIPIVPVATLVFGFLIGWWTVRKIRSGPILHGALVGILATLIYLGLCLVNPDGLSGVVAVYGMFLFVLANALRIVGCVAGAYVYRPRTP